VSRLRLKLMTGEEESDIHQPFITVYVPSHSTTDTEVTSCKLQQAVLHHTDKDTAYWTWEDVQVAASDELDEFQEKIY
jgi:hypothetical protein